MRSSPHPGGLSRTEEWRIAMTESLRHFEAFLRAPSRRNQEWATAALLRGEILRQLGRFAEAAQHLRTLESRAPSFAPAPRLRESGACAYCRIG